MVNHCSTGARGIAAFTRLYKVKAGKALGVILRLSTRCYLTYKTFPPDSTIQDHLPVARHFVQDPIRHTCILSIVRTNKDIKRHHVYFTPDYRRHLVTWHLAASHTLHIYSVPHWIPQGNKLCWKTLSVALNCKYFTVLHL